MVESRVIRPRPLAFLALGIALGLFLLQWPDPAGPNGYFYLKNIQEVSAGHGFYFRDYSFAFFFPALLNLFLRSPHASWAVAAGLTLAWIPASLTTLVEARTRRTSALLPAFVTLLVLSLYPLLELGLVYFKNAFALACALAAMASLAKALASAPPGQATNPTPRPRAFFAAAALALLSVLSHKTMLFWLLALPALLFSPEITAALQQRQARRRWFSLALLAALLLAALAALLYRRLSHQVGAALSFDPDSDPFYFWIRHSLEEEPAFAYATYFAWASWFFYAFRAWKRPRQEGLALFVWSALLLLDFHPWQTPGSSGLHYRLWLLLPVVPVYCAGNLFVSGRLRATFLMAALALAAAWSWGDTQENLTADFLDYETLRPQVEQIPRFVNQDDRLICRHGLEFYVDFVTNIRCRSFVDHAPKPNTWRVVYTGDIASRAAMTQLQAASPLAIGKSYLLMPESAWQNTLAKYHLHSSSDNPAEERPDFISDQQ